MSNLVLIWDINNKIAIDIYFLFNIFMSFSKFLKQHIYLFISRKLVSFILR